jgi:hypothetical protein
MPTRELLDVVYDLYNNTVLLWQPVAAILVLKLLSGLAASVRRCRILRAIDWTVTWALVAVILLIVQTSVRF